MSVLIVNPEAEKSDIDVEIDKRLAQAKALCVISDEAEQQLRKDLKADYFWTIETLIDDVQALRKAQHALSQGGGRA